MSIAWEQSYVCGLRKAVGHRKLICPSVNAIVTDETRRLLWIRRKDSGTWGLPSGFMELGESVYDAMRREVRAETGLEVSAATLIALYSGPEYSFTNRYGDEYQMFDFLFRVDAWTGTPATETED